MLPFISIIDPCIVGRLTILVSCIVAQRPLDPHHSKPKEFQLLYLGFQSTGEEGL